MNSNTQKNSTTIEEDTKLTLKEISEIDTRIPVLETLIEKANQLLLNEYITNERKFKGLTLDLARIDPSFFSYYKNKKFNKIRLQTELALKLRRSMVESYLNQQKSELSSEKTKRSYLMQLLTEFKKCPECLGSGIFESRQYIRGEGQVNTIIKSIKCKKCEGTGLSDLSESSIKEIDKILLGPTLPNTRIKN